MQVPARIVVIEDNPANMELMVYLLQAYGHDALCACDGVAGLALVLQVMPDLVICDVNLPRLDGYGVVGSLKRQSALQAIPVVAVSALAMVGDREKLLSAGFDGYISKPIDPETFVAQIESHFRVMPSVRGTGDGAPLDGNE